MKLCKDCDETTMICAFCRHSHVANEEETHEWLYCEFHNKGVDNADSCDEFWCDCEGGEYE